MQDTYEAKIELFKMILERNELCRLRTNALMRCNYTFKIEKRSHDRMLKHLYALRNTIKIGETQSFNAVDEAINKRRADIRAEEYASEESKLRLLELSKATNDVYNFTRTTGKRRKQLQKLLQTKQHKNCNNKIESIAVLGKRYSINDMKKIVNDYEAERIILGE